MLIDGITGEGTTEFATKVRARYDGLFEILYRINRHATSLLDGFQIEADDLQGILVSGFFLRVIDNVQASVVLSERGFSTQSRVVLRAALESQFSLRACLSWEFCEKLIAADMVKRKKMLRKAESLSKVSKVRGLDEMLASERITQFLKGVSEIDAPDIPTIEIAKVAGCYDLYLGAYATLSTAVHSTVSDIERNMVISDDGGIKAISKEPSLDDVAFQLVCAIESLLNASMAAGAFLEKDHMDYWKQEHEALRTISDIELVKTGVIRP